MADLSDTPKSQPHRGVCLIDAASSGVNSLDATPATKLRGPLGVPGAPDPSGPRHEFFVP
jgi:hypothetical protein